MANEKLREEIDSHYTRPLAGSSVEIATDNSPERNQTVNVRSFPHSETPEQFKERIDNEGEE